MKIIPNRKITGYSAILLPFTVDGSVDWDAFCAHVARTAGAGLIPAVNMDTGYGNLIDEQTRVDVLRRTRDTLSGQDSPQGHLSTPRQGTLSPRTNTIAKLSRFNPSAESQRSSNPSD